MRFNRRIRYSKDPDTNLATDLPHAKLEKTRRALTFALRKGAVDRQGMEEKREGGGRGDAKLSHSRYTPPFAMGVAPSL